MRIRSFGSRLPSLGLSPCGRRCGDGSSISIGLAVLLETLEKPHLAELQLFVALNDHIQFSFSQDSILAISGQVRDQLTLTPYAALTINNAICGRTD
jgi:hypothetical protein